jgi:tetratricopeptide (TPR) repeat protein
VTPACRELLSTVSFRGGRPAASERARPHLAGCARCAAALEIAALTRHAAAAAAGPPLSDLARERLLRQLAPSLDALASSFAAPTGARRHHRRALLLAAAIVALAALAAAAWRAFRHGDDAAADRSVTAAVAPAIPARAAPPAVGAAIPARAARPAIATPAATTSQPGASSARALPTTTSGPRPDASSLDAGSAHPADAEVAVPLAVDEAPAPAAAPDPEAWYQEAEAALRDGRPDEAERRWQALCAAFPAHPLTDLALYDLARLGMRRGREREALASVDRLLARDRDPALREPARRLRCKILAALEPDAAAACRRAFAADYPDAPHAAPEASP